MAFTATGFSAQWPFWDLQLHCSLAGLSWPATNFAQPLVDAMAQKDCESASYASKWTSDFGQIFLRKFWHRADSEWYQDDFERLVGLACNICGPPLPGSSPLQCHWVPAWTRWAWTAGAGGSTSHHKDPQHVEWPQGAESKGEQSLVKVHLVIVLNSMLKELEEILGHWQHRGFVMRDSIEGNKSTLDPKVNPVLQ